MTNKDSADTEQSCTIASQLMHREACSLVALFEFLLYLQITCFIPGV